MLALTDTEQNPRFLGKRHNLVGLAFGKQTEKKWEDEPFHCIPSLDLEPKKNLGGVCLASWIQRFLFPVNQLPAAPRIPGRGEASSVGGLFLGWVSYFVVFLFQDFGWWNVQGVPKCKELRWKENVEWEKFNPTFPNLESGFGWVHSMLSSSGSFPAWNILGFWNKTLSVPPDTEGLGPGSWKNWELYFPPGIAQSLEASHKAPTKGRWSRHQNSWIP